MLTNYDFGKNLDYEYHLKQYKEEKRSTVFFIDWLQKKNCFKKGRVLDIACGSGANTSLLGGGGVPIN